MHAPLDLAETDVLAATIESAVKLMGTTQAVTIDVRRAGFCNTKSLELIARAVERGVAIRTDALRGVGGDERPDTEVAAAEGTGR